MNGWRWLDQAPVRPHRCALIPFIVNGKGHRFLDVGQDLDREHVYISDVAAEQIAKAVGYVHPARVQEAEQSEAALQSKLEELEAENAELRDFKESVDALMKHGLTPKKVAGRKPKQKQEA